MEFSKKWPVKQVSTNQARETKASLVKVFGISGQRHAQVHGRLNRLLDDFKLIDFVEFDETRPNAIILVQ